MSGLRLHPSSGTLAFGWSSAVRSRSFCQYAAVSRACSYTDLDFCTLTLYKNSPYQHLCPVVVIRVQLPPAGWVVRKATARATKPLQQQKQLRYSLRKAEQEALAGKGLLHAHLTLSNPNNSSSSCNRHLAGHAACCSSAHAYHLHVLLSMIQVQWFPPCCWLWLWRTSCS